MYNPLIQRHSGTFPLYTIRILFSHPSRSRSRSLIRRLFNTSPPVALLPPTLKPKTPHPSPIPVHTRILKPSPRVCLPTHIPPRGCNTPSPVFLSQMLSTHDLASKPSEPRPVSYKSASPEAGQHAYFAATVHVGSRGKLCFSVRWDNGKKRNLELSHVFTRYSVRTVWARIGRIGSIPVTGRNRQVLVVLRWCW
jgi:hypothetical protein